MKFSCFSISTLPRVWFFAKNKIAVAKRGFRDRRKQTLFIDARKRATFPTQVDQHEYQHRLAA